MKKAIDHSDIVFISQDEQQRDGYVFISYKREELEEAKKIRRALLDYGFNVWWDEDIQCGQVWSEVLDEAVKHASCVVVLWSRKSMLSRWVMHEASRAIGRGVYSPVRIELCAINSPYDRLQATDIFEWDGQTHHPGVVDLLKRIKDLLPIRKPFLIRLIESCWSNRTTIASLVFAIAALGILSWQTLATRSQMIQMDILLAKQQQDRDQRNLEVFKQINNQQSILSRVEEQSEKSSKTLETIRRNFNRIESISGTAWLKIPYKHKAFNTYHARLRNEVDEFLKNPDESYDMYISQSGRNSDGSLDFKKISIPFDSEVFPQEGEQPIKRLLTMGISASVYSRPIQEKKFRPARWSGVGQPDLQMSFVTKAPDLQVDLENYSLELFTEISTNQKYWDTNGRIASIDDLPGAQLWFYIDPPSGFKADYSGSELNNQLLELVQRAEIGLVVLRINEIDFLFEKEQLIRIDTKDDTPAWVINLPIDREKLYEDHVSW